MVGSDQCSQEVDHVLALSREYLGWLGQTNTAKKWIMYWLGHTSILDSWIRPTQPRKNRSVIEEDGNNLS